MAQDRTTLTTIRNIKPFYFLVSKSGVMYRVVNHAVQLHGGYGLMEEYPVAKFYRDQKLLEIGEGTSEIQRIVISRSLGCYD